MSREAHAGFGGEVRLREIADYDRAGRFGGIASAGGVVVLVGLSDGDLHDGECPSDLAGSHSESRTADGTAPQEA